MTRVLSEGFISGLLAAMVRIATPLMLAGIGELVGQRAGVLNLGIEGIMLMGALTGFLVTWLSGTLVLGVAAAIGVGMVFGIVHSWITVRQGGDQIVTGLTVTILGAGLAVYIGRSAFRVGGNLPQIEGFQPLDLWGANDMPFVGPALFGQNVFTYVTWTLVIVAAAVLAWTQLGVAIRGAGENPTAVGSLGVDVVRLRTWAVVWGSACAGAAGAYMSLALLSFYTDSIIGGRGFIVIAVVMFGRWNPIGMAGGAVLFGLVDALQLRLQTMQMGIPSELMTALPYVLTLTILVWVGRRGEIPAALAVPYRPAAAR